MTIIMSYPQPCSKMENLSTTMYQEDVCFGECVYLVAITVLNVLMFVETKLQMSLTKFLSVTFFCGGGGGAYKCPVQVKWPLVTWSKGHLEETGFFDSQPLLLASPNTFTGQSKTCTWQFCWWPFWDGENVSLSRRIVTWKKLATNKAHFEAPGSFKFTFIHN